MTFLETVLGALDVCTALLIRAGPMIGPERSGSGSAGLTAAQVLSSDGMTPDGCPGDAASDRPALDWPIDAVSEGKDVVRPSPSAG